MKGGLITGEIAPLCDVNIDEAPPELRPDPEADVVRVGLKPMELSLAGKDVWVTLELAGALGPLPLASLPLLLIMSEPLPLALPLRLLVIAESLPSALSLDRLEGDLGVFDPLEYPAHRDVPEFADT